MLRTRFPRVEKILTRRLVCVPKKKEIIDLKMILDETLLFFSEKIDKDELMIIVDLPELSHFVGDFDLLLALLLNIVGKPIYRTPQGGRLSIVAEKEDDFFFLQIYDDGYPIRSLTENLIEKSCDLFISGQDLHQLCEENGFIYRTSEMQYRLNMSEIIFPLDAKEDCRSNVIQLFPRKRKVPGKL